MSVYLIRHKPSRRIKIGRANDVQARLRSLRTAWPVPEDFEIVGVLPTVDSDAATEAAAHRAYASLKVHGEWFREEGELAEFLLTLKPPTSFAKFVRVEGTVSQASFWQRVTGAELISALSGRHLRIAGAYRRGKMLGEIGAVEGCSRQRIHQILTKCRDRVLLHRHSRA